MNDASKKGIEMPHYNHDCNQCIFLGEHVEKGNVQDTYYCPKSFPFHGSLIIRFSSKGSDYISVPFDLFKIQFKNLDSEYMQYSTFLKMYNQVIDLKLSK